MAIILNLTTYQVVFKEEELNKKEEIKNQNYSALICFHIEVH